MIMKEQYELLQMEVIEFEKEDVIVTSGGIDDDEIQDQIIVNSIVYVCEENDEEIVFYRIICYITRLLFFDSGACRRNRYY